MRKTLARQTFFGLAVAAMAAGCHQDNPPPPRAMIPPPGTYTASTEAPPKPLPPQTPPMQPGFADQPLLIQPPPEQPAFVMSYEHVGRPRMTLFVNRTLAGSIVPTSTRQTLVGVEQTRKTTGAVTMDGGGELRDYYGRPYAESHDKFQTNGPAEVRDRTEIYLAPGEYDELNARRVDYDAIENVMQDWLSANGRVTLVSPNLSQSQADQLTKGNAGPLTTLSRDQQIDVLVQVQAKATRQTQQGLAVRLIGEALDTATGASLGRAFVDVPPPLEKPVINEYTRYLCRKLMSDMTDSWNAPRPQPAPSPQQGPTTTPATTQP